MGKLKTAFRSVDHFIKDHFILILVVVLGGYWMLHDTVSFPRPVPYGSHDYAMNEPMYAEESMEMAAMDMAGAAPRVMKSMSRGRIAMADDGFDPNAEDRKLIKNANLSLEVGDTDEAKQLVESEVANLEGSITNMNSWQVRPEVLGYNLTIRIPSENLDTLMENLSKVGVKTSEGFNTTDITASYRDTAARIANLESRRDRLRKLLEFETESLADVLQVDRELSTVQLEIERLEKTQQKRNIDVSYSTVRVNLQPETQIGDANNPHWSVENSWKVAVSDLIQASHKIFDKGLKLVAFAPIWVPVLLILWLIKWMFSRKKKKVEVKKKK